MDNEKKMKKRNGVLLCFFSVAADSGDGVDYSSPSLQLQVKCLLCLSFRPRQWPGPDLSSRLFKVFGFFRVGLSSL